MAEQEPLSADELAEVRERSEYALIREHVDTYKFAGMVASLEDVPRLLATVEAYREIVEWLAVELPDYDSALAMHKKARALLAKE